MYAIRSYYAFKLIELHERFNLISTGDNVIDLGAAPGGWTQIAIIRITSYNVCYTKLLRELEQWTKKLNVLQALCFDICDFDIRKIFKEIPVI